MEIKIDKNHMNALHSRNIDMFIDLEVMFGLV